MPYALFAYLLVATITPGPNNLMIMSSGATFGLRGTLPAMIGVSIGLGTLVTAAGLGIGMLLQDNPALFLALQILAIAYIVWLAWVIATSWTPIDAEAHDRPIGTVPAIALQWVNPKAWATALGAISGFARPDGMARDLPLIIGVLIFVGLSSTFVWASFGCLLQDFLRRRAARRLFNWTMAALLLASTFPSLLDLIDQSRSGNAAALQGPEATSGPNRT